MHIYMFLIGSQPNLWLLMMAGLDWLCGWLAVDLLLINKVKSWKITKDSITNNSKTQLWFPRFIIA